MIPLAEARAHVLRACRPLAPRRLPCAAALGCVLAADAVALEDVPPFDNTAVDGYALRAVDTERAPVELQVVATVMAGAVSRHRVGPGEAIRIMTGAPIPEGADAVCMVEATRSLQGSASTPEDAVVVIETEVRPGDHVRRAGSDVGTGTVVFASGTRIGPAHLGVLVATGVTEVEVIPRPRVGVLSTGDELSEGTGPLRPGTIRDSNRPSLLAQLERDGFEAVDLGLVGDDARDIVSALEDGVRSCDAVLTSGGVSVGDHDLVKAVLEELSTGAMRWMQIAIRPAKPFAFGVLPPAGTPVFGLPGNPVSALVSYELLVRPALRLLGGHVELDRPKLRAVAPEGLRRRSDGKLHLVRVSAVLDESGMAMVRSAGGQSSHQLRAMAEANALALVPDGEGIAPGGAVDVLLLDAERFARTDDAWTRR